MDGISSSSAKTTGSSVGNLPPSATFRRIFFSIGKEKHVLCINSEVRTAAFFLFLVPGCRRRRCNCCPSALARPLYRNICRHQIDARGYRRHLQGRRNITAHKHHSGPSPRRLFISSWQRRGSRRLTSAAPSSIYTPVSMNNNEHCCCCSVC